MVAARRARATVAVLLVLGLCAMVGIPDHPAGAISPAEPREDLTKRIDAYVTERMAARGIPGASVAVVRGGRTVHLAGYGIADPTGTPVTPDTPFLLGSASKPLTAAAVLQLVQDGVVALDEPVLPHLPAASGAPPAGFEAITIEHLLTHTSGISMLTGLRGVTRPPQGADALDRRVADIAGRRLRAEPGERFDYSNANYILLAAVVEHVTGEAFAEHMDAEVFAPLGMASTFATDGHPRAEDLATGHRAWFGRWRPATLPHDPAGAAMGYMGSTARDLARFLTAQLGDDDAVVVRNARDLARGPAVSTGWDGVPLEAGYTTGWAVDEMGGLPVVSHAGSLAHFTTHLILVPDADELGIAVQTNASAFVAAGHEGQYDLSLGLAAMLLDVDRDPVKPGLVLSMVLPAAAWLVVALLLLVGGLHLRRLREAHLRELRMRGRRGRGRIVAPALGALGIGVALLLAPLPIGRLFYPDLAWAVTTAASAGIGWGVGALLLTLRSGSVRIVD